MLARREISAREIGAPLRIVSSTVCSLIRLSRVGIAAARPVVAILVNNPNEEPGLRGSRLTLLRRHGTFSFGKLTNKGEASLASTEGWTVQEAARQEGFHETRDDG